jgi:two-component sensor histidine kinase
MVTVVIAIFIYSGDYLAKQKLAEIIMDMQGQTKETVIGSLESFEIITWVSIWIILCVGLGGIFLVGSWNTELQKKVKERTLKLKETEVELKASLGEKEVLLQEIHHRVKNNLAVVVALLDLQYMRCEDKSTLHVLSDAKARIKSMAFVHETLYQTENFSKIELRSYLKRLSDSIGITFKENDKEIDLQLDIEDVNLEMNRAVPLGLIINELIVNAYKHAFEGMERGEIKVSMYKNGKEIEVHVCDNGTGIDDNKQITKSKSLGITLIKTLARQIKANFEVESEPGKTNFSVTFKKEIEAEV